METTIKRKLSIAAIEALFFGSDICIKQYDCLEPANIDEDDLTKPLLYKIRIRHAEDTTAEKEYTSAINKYKRKMKAGQPDHETECKRLYEEIGPSAVYEYGVKNKMPFSYCYRCEAETPTLNAHATKDNCAICGSPVNE